MELSPGSVLLGKYRIDELIGTGGMGNVVRASHLYLHQAVAIKVLLPQMAESDSTKQRFLREAQATVKLKSEHSARVMDVGTTPEGVPFMVMEFLDGNDLNQILRHHGPQLPAIVVDLMLQACEGIAEAHALGIVHRDIKPSNFFITRRPDGSMLLKILDFGISKTPVGYDDLTGTQTVIGTPSYMAPEQMKSGRSADPRSDIWSIGVVIYQLITGRPPFAGESYAELVLKVGLEPPTPLMMPLPAGLGEIIMRCLEKDPNVRFQNVGDLARVLAPYATDPVIAAQSANRTMRTLQHRGAQSMIMGMQGSPLTANGGLSGPVPISPAQLTPRTWPPSQATSLSQGAGQVTRGARHKRGWVIAGIASLCVAAGVGGYAVSQASRDGGRSEPREPHVQAPPMPAVAPAGVPTTPAAVLAPSTAPWKPSATQPTIREEAGKPSEPAPDQPAEAHTLSNTLIDAANPAGKPIRSPAAKPTGDAHRSIDPFGPSSMHQSSARTGDAAKPTTKPSGTAKPTTKPSDTAKPTTKPSGKPKKSDSLFDSRQ